MIKSFKKTVNERSLVKENFFSNKKKLNTRNSKMRRKSAKLLNVRLKSKDSVRKRPIVRNKKKQNRQDRLSSRGNLRLN
jgi:hypothetical protein